MQSVSKYIWAGVKLLALCLCGVLFVMVRYILETPQPLDSVLTGESRLYKWKRGHIFYKVVGDAAAPPLVLWHAPSIGGSGYEMRLLVAQLARSYRVYVPDLLGFGLSDHPEGVYTASLYVSLYQDFLAEVVAQPAVLVASGLSGNYCVEVAARRPELCARLVLLSPLPLFKEHKRPAWRVLLTQNALVGFFLYAIATSHIALRNSIAKRLGLAGVYIPSEELEYTYAVAHQLGAQRAALAWLAGRLDLPVSQQLSTLQVPVLILWGEHALQELCHMMPLAAQIRVETLPGAGERPHEEQARRVVDYILEGQEPQSPGEQPSVNPPGQPISETASEKIAASLEEAPQMTRQEEPGSLLQPEQEQSSAEIIGTASPSVEEEVTVQPVVESYCMKCRQKRPMQNAREVTTKNGRRALEGQCPLCGTKLFRFGGSK